MFLKERDWVPEHCEAQVQAYAGKAASSDSNELIDSIQALARRSQQIHEKECFNLNPATNVMNPLAEALLASRLGSRPSLGYPGDKYETGLEAIEEIEVITAELCARVFDAHYAEVRVPSGAIANLYAYMATCAPGDTIIAPPASIGGHVTHHADGCAGLFGLKTIEAPVDASGYSVDLDSLRALAMEVRPKLITLGGSLNLFEHPVAAVREIADDVGAFLLFDAAHQCGIIAGKAWRNPLLEGAHLMTMSTYKSLGGPASGLVLTNNAALAEKLDHIAYPGMTANFDASKTAALAITMLDWIDHGKEYAAKMIAVAQSLAEELQTTGLSVYAADQGFTESHQFALDATNIGGGQTASKQLRSGGFLTCGIGLPIKELSDDLNGLRIGTPELVRWGVTESDTSTLASLMARTLSSDNPGELATETAAFRQKFQKLCYINQPTG